MLVVAVVFAAVSGCASSYMRNVDTRLTPGADYAVVSFVRPQAFAFGQTLSIWDRDRFIGMLDAKRLIQYRASPGEHVFMGRAGNWAYVKATVEAGKHYVVVARMFPADATVTMSNIGVALNPSGKEKQYSDEDINGWISGLTATEPVPEKVAEYETQYKADVTQAVADYQAGKVEFVELAPDDNRL